MNCYHLTWPKISTFWLENNKNSITPVAQIWKCQNAKNLTRLILVLTNVTLITEKPEKALDSISPTLQSMKTIDNDDENVSVGNCGIVATRRNVIDVNGVSIGKFGLNADIDSRSDLTSSNVTSSSTSKARESMVTVPERVTRRLKRP